MLRSLTIRNVVLIEKLDLAFRGGLGVLTGETGSGKSILLDALGLALGARADTDLISTGADQGSATAEFELENCPAIDRLLADNDLADEGWLVLRRSISGGGRSRAFVNDRPVSASLLRRIGEALVEIHGQLEAHGLLDGASHAGYVDAYGGHQKLLAATAANKTQIAPQSPSSERGFGQRRLTPAALSGGLGVRVEQARRFEGTAGSHPRLRSGGSRGVSRQGSLPARAAGSFRPQWWFSTASKVIRSPGLISSCRQGPLPIHSLAALSRPTSSMYAVETTPMPR